MLKKIFSLALVVYSTCACLSVVPAVQAKTAPTQDYKRIVIVSDAHYPVKVTVSPSLTSGSRK
jgi:hypothetical protein